MSTPLDIEDVCNRGFRDATSLTPEELFIYLLTNLELLREMEGWDHFFTTDRMLHYRHLIAGLEAAGDSVSAEILQDYEKHFSRYGVPFEPVAISEFLSLEPEDYMSACRDWQSEFEFARETRWNKVRAYLTRRGYTLVG